MLARLQLLRSTWAGGGLLGAAAVDENMVILLKVRLAGICSCFGVTGAP